MSFMCELPHTGTRPRGEDRARLAEREGACAATAPLRRTNTAARPLGPPPDPRIPNRDPSRAETTQARSERPGRHRVLPRAFERGAPPLRVGERRDGARVDRTAAGPRDDAARRAPARKACLAAGSCCAGTSGSGLCGLFVHRPKSLAPGRGCARNLWPEGFTSDEARHAPIERRASVGTDGSRSGAKRARRPRVAAHAEGATASPRRRSTRRGAPPHARARAAVPNLVAS
jgi:hypothetical protein